MACLAILADFTQPSSFGLWLPLSRWPRGPAANTTCQSCAAYFPGAPPLTLTTRSGFLPYLPASCLLSSILVPRSGPFSFTSTGSFRLFNISGSSSYHFPFILQPTVYQRSEPLSFTSLSLDEDSNRQSPRTPTMSTSFNNYAASLCLLCIMIGQASASPLPLSLTKRDLSSGATAGIGIGIAIVIIAIAVGCTFFWLARQRDAHNAQINKERAVLAGEKNADGTNKYDKFSAQPVEESMPKRNKSVKDRLMGPLYRGSMINLPPIPPKAKIGASGLNRQSTMTVGEGNDSWLNRPWTATQNSPRPSFSSKRATRMMMMM